MEITYDGVLSLEHIALIKISVSLWSKEAGYAWNLEQNDLLKENYPLNQKDLLWQARNFIWKVTEKKVAHKAKALLLPDTLECKLLDYVLPIGLQIRKWFVYLNKKLDPLRGSNMVDKLHWTPQGIDNIKSAEALIEDGSLGIDKCYELSCIYCLGSNIKIFWEKMPEDIKKLYCTETDPVCIFKRKLWNPSTYDINDEVTKRNNVFRNISHIAHQCALKSLAFRSKVAVEYFLKYLTLQEKEESLVNIAETTLYCQFLPKRFLFSEKCSDILFFLLLQMNEGQQEELFKSHAFAVLVCFLDWPWQSYFLKMANKLWHFLHKESFHVLLNTIYRKVRPYNKNSVYQELFRKFWQQSPKNFKEFVINACESSSDLLCHLFDIGDRKNITLVLSYATPTEKESLIYCSQVKKIFRRETLAGNWKIIKFFISECISSKENWIKFVIGTFLFFNDGGSAENETPKRFFNLQNNLTNNAVRKKNMEEC